MCSIKELAKVVQAFHSFFSSHFPPLSFGAAFSCLVFPPLLFGAAFSCLAFSTPVIFMVPHFHVPHFHSPLPDINPFAKLHFHPIRGFCPHIWEVAYQLFIRLVFFRCRLGRCADFDDQYVKRRRSRARSAFWRSRKPFLPREHMRGGSWES